MPFAIAKPPGHLRWSVHPEERSGFERRWKLRAFTTPGLRALLPNDLHTWNLVVSRLQEEDLRLIVAPVLGIRTTSP